MQTQAALLIGDITHARKEWEDFASVLTLKVRTNRIYLFSTEFERIREKSSAQRKDDGQVEEAKMRKN
jgi:hypothetical protein